MLSYRDFTKHFGTSLSDEGFQNFLHNTFSDLTEYDILESDYITSEKDGVELGFTNNEAVYDDDENIVFEKGNPIFSHFVLYPKSLALIDNLPFDTNFDNNRIEIIKKAGNPTQTKEGYADFLNNNFLVDNYKVGDIIITFDYNAEKQTINFIQVRDNNLRTNIKL
jgi:hypothetical protein